MNVKLELIMKCLLLLAVAALIVPSATAIIGLDDTLTNAGAGQVSKHGIIFQLEQNLPADGKIEIGFDSGFNITKFTNDTPVTGIDGTYTWSRDANKIIITRMTGNQTSAWSVISFTLGNITNPSTIGDKSIEVVTKTALGTQIELGTTTVTIVAGPATKFRINPINNQVAGEPFTVTVTALDQFDHTNTTFLNDSAVLNSSIGPINPNIMNGVNGTWIDGVWTGNAEKINKTGESVTIKATSGIITGESNAFKVNPALLGSFFIFQIQDRYDELPFEVRARAFDTFGNFKDDYNGNDTLSIVPNGTDGRFISIAPHYAQFAAGNYLGTVKVDVVDTNVPQPTYYDARLKIRNETAGIERNSRFNVTELPVDLVNSTVVAYPPIVPEDGVSKSNITVTVKNIFGGTIIGTTVSISSDRGGVDITETVNGITDSEGKARFTVRSFAKGTANLTAQVKGVYTLNTVAKVYFGYDNKLHLLKDWNLVSVPWQLANSDINALNTTKVARIYYYDAASSPKVWKYAIYDRANDTWSGTLTTIDDGKGYWMFASAPDDVPINLKPVEGGGTPPAYPLKAGWNMIGYTQKDLKPYLYTVVYIWPDLYYQSDMEKPIWDAMYEWTGSEYKAQYPWEIGYQRVVITRGYWIFLQDDDTLVP